MFNAMVLGTICNSEDLKVLAKLQNSGSETLSEDTRIVSETAPHCVTRCAAQLVEVSGTTCGGAATQWYRQMWFDFGCVFHDLVTSKKGSPLPSLLDGGGGTWISNEETGVATGCRTHVVLRVSLLSWSSFR